eukprot:1131055-Rhodomonas_salina.1
MPYTILQDTAAPDAAPAAEAAPAEAPADSSSSPVSAVRFLPHCWSHRCNLDCQAASPAAALLVRRGEAVALASFSPPEVCCANRVPMGRLPSPMTTRTP